MLKKIYRGILNILPYKTKLVIRYFRAFKRFPNFKQPQTFNEKVLNRIIFEKNPIYSQLADKYEVRKYIEEKIGKEYLVPLIAVYEKADELNKIFRWENMVIKPNHGAGMVEIIDEEPSIVEKKRIIQKAQEWLNFDFSKFTGEWHYSLINPKLLVEEKITNKNQDLRDYKFHRFLRADGTYKNLLQVIAERSELGFETSFFDVDNLDYIIHSPYGYEIKLNNTEKKAIRKIINLNNKLCKNLNYVRLDWYITENKIYFGEITLTPGSGLSRNFAGEFGDELGKLWIDKKENFFAID
ncbi:ATP-grasp fold amidoligase family protein [Acinetobacter schindleri]|uniref:ATP-grasp fold amidoligase family protein n=1 Tax=Acinetobacter schindleri TaxID=108981 RepID=UPI003F56958A